MQIEFKKDRNFKTQTKSSLFQIFSVSIFFEGEKEERKFLGEQSMSKRAKVSFQLGFHIFSAHVVERMQYE